MIWGNSLPFFIYFWHRKNCILVVFLANLVSLNLKGKIPFCLLWCGILVGFFPVKLHLWISATCRFSWLGQAAPRKVTEPFILSNREKKIITAFFQDIPSLLSQKKWSALKKNWIICASNDSRVLNFTDWYFCQSKESVKNCLVLLLFSFTSKPVSVHWWIKLNTLLRHCSVSIENS